MSSTSLPGPLGSDEPEDIEAELPPVSGATLFRLEMSRRVDVRDKGVISMGCGEIDDVVLLGGGFERGAVVGVSAEVEDFGLSLGLQTVARALVYGESGREAGAGGPKVAIITILPTLAISLRLRDAIRYQLQAKLGPRREGINDEVRRCLEAVDVSQVFDVDGLGLVLQDMEVSMYAQGETSGPSQRGDTREDVDEQPDVDVEVEEVQGPREDSIPRPGSNMSLGSNDRVTELPPLRIQNVAPPPRIQKTVIDDSEDEEPFSSSPLSSLDSDDLPHSSSAPVPDDEPEHQSDPDPDPDLNTNSPSPILPATVQEPSPTAVQPTTGAPTTPKFYNTEEATSQIPEIILITHFSTLLTTLFTNTNHDRTRAHTTLQRLSSHLRYLARSSGSLVMLLNTTTSHTSTPQNQYQNQNANQPPILHDPNTQRREHKPLDPSLRSIFSPSGGGNGGYRGEGGGVYGKRNKPNFGQTFTQFLDLHVLCTKVPRSRDDAEAYVKLGTSEEGVHMVWVVEVLMDELGFWDWGSLRRMFGEEDRGAGKGEKSGGKGLGMGMGKRRGEEDERLPVRVNREQRWGAVVLRDGVVVNAFRKEVPVDRGPVRVVAGFGGLRV
ncbi:hypothetical protein F5Y18DRAFT_442726 [Xylariaceae sp. FL1019]|nr:hypothetical protein F5Y18DRAFT_442726 [Xylariaceae sp. FL1019]